MAEYGVSTSELVSNVKPARLTQYIAALSAALGALSFGTALGYTSPAGPLLTNNSTNTSLTLSSIEYNFFSSSVNLGALVGGPLGGFCINAIGRKGTMLASVPLYLASWAFIAFGQDFAMLLIGRIIIGLCAGLTCLAAPTFISEFSSADVRGTLGAGFQLMMGVGILYTYIFGAITDSWRVLAGICAVPPAVHFVMIFFTKESPSYLLSKGKETEATQAMQYFRGKNYDIQPELQALRESLSESQGQKTSLSDLTRPYILKPLLIAIGLMFFQQFSGVNAVLFNLKDIFADSGTDLSDDVSSIIVGVVQVLSTVTASALIDRAGRKILLIISATAMMVALVALGSYFYIKTNDGDTSGLSWLPITSLMVFISAFSFGYGPIPWLMMSELFSPNVREAATSLSTMSNWAMSFIVTLVFAPLREAIQDYGVYWLFGGICAVNVAFAALLVPETKGKTLQEITAFFGGPSSGGGGAGEGGRGDRRASSSSGSSLEKMRY